MGDDLARAGGDDGWDEEDQGADDEEDEQEEGEEEEEGKEMEKRTKPIWRDRTAPGVTWWLPEEVTHPSSCSNSRSYGFNRRVGFRRNPTGG